MYKHVRVLSEDSLLLIIIRYFIHRYNVIYDCKQKQLKQNKWWLSEICSDDELY